MFTVTHVFYLAAGALFGVLAGLIGGWSEGREGGMMNPRSIRYGWVPAFYGLWGLASVAAILYVFIPAFTSPRTTAPTPEMFEYSTYFSGAEYSRFSPQSGTISFDPLWKVLVSALALIAINVVLFHLAKLQKLMTAVEWVQEWHTFSQEVAHIENDADGVVLNFSNYSKLDLSSEEISIEHAKGRWVKDVLRGNRREPSHHYLEAKSYFDEAEGFLASLAERCVGTNSDVEAGRAYRPSWSERGGKYLLIAVVVDVLAVSLYLWAH